MVNTIGHPLSRIILSSFTSYPEPLFTSLKGQFVNANHNIIFFYIFRENWNYFLPSRYFQGNVGLLWSIRELHLPYCATLWWNEWQVKKATEEDVFITLAFCCINSLCFCQQSSNSSKYTNTQPIEFHRTNILLSSFSTVHEHKTDVINTP